MAKNKLEKFNNFVIFQTEKGKVNIDVLFQNETLWLPQKLIAELFEVNVPAVSKHLKNIFETGELEENSVISILETTAEDGKNYKTKYYNLKAITAVGYRVNSHRATEFRKWATEVLHEYIIKGFAMDDERLKQIKHFGKDYFDEMLERIREIRLSERRIYQKITDIYALSADYSLQAEITKHFFATVQNKLHWAITGKTAAEIIYTEADAKKIYMGLKTWKNAPKGKILKSDVIIAKNYLNEEHIHKLNKIVNSYLDIAESRAENEVVMNMKDWDKYLQQFLELTNRPILKDKGKISMLEAKLKAESEYDKYRVIQDKNYISDFDTEIQRLFQAEEKVLNNKNEVFEISLKQRILESQKPFTLFHTHIVTEKSINEAIRTNKSIDLDISVDKNENPYLGHTEEYYEINGTERPKTMDFDKAIEMIAKAHIPVIVDCKHHDAWNIVEDIVEKIGAHRCLVHSFISDFKFDYNLSYDHDYPTEWSSASKLKSLKKKFPNVTTTASCKFLPEDLLVTEKYQNILKKIRKILTKNNIDTVCLNVPDDTMINEVLDFFLSQNIIPHINIDGLHLEKITKPYVGETDILNDASDCETLNYR